MALKINFKANERFVVNGAVISVGDKTTPLTFHNQARILRQKEVLTPEIIRQIALNDEGIDPTPSWFYYLIQLHYITPEDAERYLPQLTDTVEKLRQIYPENIIEINNILGLLADGECFSALRACVELFPGCRGEHLALENTKHTKVKPKNDIRQNTFSEDLL